MTLTSFGPANRIQRSAETHPLTWRLRDDGEAVWLDEYQAKNGYAAARKAFADMSQDDIEQVGLFVNKRFPYEELAAIRHGHLSLQQVRPFLGEDMFAGYFKFAFVRNPFDRFVSYCAFMSRDSGHFATNPQAVMRYFLFDAPPEQHILFQPQSSLLVDGDGRLLTDMVGRVETMQDSYEAICARIGIPARVLDQVNSSRRGDYRSYYTDELREAVATRYRNDIDLFDYRF